MGSLSPLAGREGLLMPLSSNLLAAQMLWEREQGDRTDPAKFHQYRVWRKNQQAAINAWEKKDWLEKLLNKTSRPHICECMTLGGYSLASAGLTLHVCSEHAAQFGIHDGIYFEDELLVLVDRIRTLGLE